MSRRAPAVSAPSGWMRRPFCKLGGDAERADQRVVAESDCYPGTSATAGRRVAGTRSWASRSAVASTNRGTPRTSTSSAQPARRRSRRVRARPGPARGDPREHARDDALGEQVGRCSVVQDSRMTSRARWSSPVGEVRTRGGAPTRGGRRGRPSGTRCRAGPQCDQRRVCPATSRGHHPSTTSTRPSMPTWRVQA